MAAAASAKAEHDREVQVAPAEVRVANGGRSRAPRPNGWRVRSRQHRVPPPRISPRPAIQKASVSGRSDEPRTIRTSGRAVMTRRANSPNAAIIARSMTYREMSRVVVACSESEITNGGGRTRSRTRSERPEPGCRQPRRRASTRGTSRTERAPPARSAGTGLPETRVGGAIVTCRPAASVTDTIETAAPPARCTWSSTCSGGSLTVRLASVRAHERRARARRPEGRARRLPPGAWRCAASEPSSGEQGSDPGHEAEAADDERDDRSGEPPPPPPPPRAHSTAPHARPVHRSPRGRTSSTIEPSE